MATIRLPKPKSSVTIVVESTKRAGSSPLFMFQMRDAQDAYTSKNFSATRDRKSVAEPERTSRGAA